jgi:hypothetical protein
MGRRELLDPENPPAAGGEMAGRRAPHAPEADHDHVVPHAARSGRAFPSGPVACPNRPASVPVRR